MSQSRAKSKPLGWVILYSDQGQLSSIPPLPEELVGTHMNRRHMKFPRSIRNRMMNAVARLGVSLGMGKRDISLNTEQTVGSNWISMHSLSVSPMVP